LEREKGVKVEEGRKTPYSRKDDHLGYCAKGGKLGLGEFLRGKRKGKRGTLVKNSSNFQELNLRLRERVGVLLEKRKLISSSLSSL